MSVTVGVLGRSIPAANYLEAIRKAKAYPELRFKQGLHSPYPTTGAEIMQQYRDDLQSRINRRGKVEPTEGRVRFQTWVRIQSPRVVLERDQIGSLNRHQKPRFAQRARDEF